ncbi:MAG TPA: hypothetical protein VHI13_18885 [Candidatus Kapabacteria bacterium]|nr:hypothetical protein [Candidatus Kapabacteria bacterium]
MGSNDERLRRDATTAIASGHIVALFAFDVGYEVVLDRVHQLASPQPVQPLSGKKQTPSYLQYTRPPLKLDCGYVEPDNPASGDVQATLFDFGAVSMSYRIPLTWNGTRPLIDDLPAISRQLHERMLERDARDRIASLMERIEAAIVRPSLSALVEDYYLIVLERLEPELTAEQLMEGHRHALAHALQFESGGLSRHQQEEALAQRISYYHGDLVLVDWNAAIIYDREYEDAASVLELLNVELLEARFTDAEIDKHIEAVSGLLHQRTGWSIPFRTPYKRTLNDLAELQIASSVLAERVDNALKLIGDLYLARLHAAAARRFYLLEWEQAISRKLGIIDNYYRLLTDRVRTAQSQTLELVVILLILVELLLALLRR